MLKTIKQYGFTLIELIIVIIIIVIIASMSFQLLFQTINGYFTAANTTDANWQGQIALQNMSRTIELIRSPADISTATASTLTFVDINNNTISYTLTGGSITQITNSNTQTLADGISSLTFSYFDKTGTSTATLTNIVFIQITINVTQKNTNFSLTSTIFPISF